MSTPQKHCITLCLAQRFNFPDLSQHLLDKRRATLFKDALIIDHKGALSIVFAYGVVVHWNVELDKRRQLHLELLEFAIHPFSDVQEDHFSYLITQAPCRIQHDRIDLENEDEKTLLAISHAMAQSIKLATFEIQALDTINTTHHLPKSLANNGQIRLNKKALARIRGQLFLTKSDIILNFDLLDTPDFFWEHPEHQGLYALVANYLELKPRTDILSKKLETIHELLEMLADEQKHQHSSTLEWIIIWLIAVEIAITLLEKVV